ncbi:MAG: MiaB/RimO family radical SAM methylthiotransferase [Dehalococcoidia bacterium]|nr:MiaB/RimO family radical SAM methylthiotransferase [Dehalococcoidia bacterium]
MPFYFIWTIGCQMNRAESERLAGALVRQGYAPATVADAADLIILNTCVVRGHAEDKVLNKLANMRTLKHKHPKMRLAVTGCFVTEDTAALVARFPFVDYFFPAGVVPDWVSLGSQALIERPGICAYVPIIHGCDNFCTYCIVPYRRGREKSRSLADIVQEVRKLVEGGTREVTLLGQNVDSYGHDLPGRSDLANLLAELADLPDLWRLRFLTNHPKDMNTRLIQAMASLEKVCQSVNLPVQAGDDDILKAMHRGYSVAHYRALVAALRNSMPEVVITTDVIVGFPGETEAQFKNTAELLKDLRFASVHVATYSPRAGTVAARLPDDVAPEIKKERLSFIEQQQQAIAGELNAALLGMEIEVLVEGRQGGKWWGRGENDKLVFFTGGEHLSGRLVVVRIDQAGPWSLQGKMGQIVK